jgi:MFS transporter, DHA3 family, macrolide efflux protein
LVNKHFNGGAVQYSWMESIIGIGVVIGGVGLGIWGGFKRKVFTSGLGLIGMGLGLFMTGVAPANWFALGLAGGCLTGMMNPIVNGPLFAIVQAKVDKEKQGRVMTLINALCTAMSPIGLLIAGPVSDKFGLQSWFIVGGISCILMTAVIFLNRDIATLDDQEPGGKLIRPVIAVEPAE